MALVDLKVVKFGSAAQWTVVNATDTFLMANDGLTKLYVSNETNQNCTVTVKEKRTCNYGHATTDAAYTCSGNNVVTHIGTFRKDRFNRVDGKIEVVFTIPGAGQVRVYGVYDQPEDGRI